MSKPKICLIYTGGTIGMIEGPDGLRPPDDPKDFLKVAPELSDIVDFDFVPLLNKDSTDMNPSDWVQMANAVYDISRRNYKGEILPNNPLLKDEVGKNYVGFVIAHGTDTMHFSSSALAFAFGQNLNFPIVFTGAQTAPKVKHGDARINLLRAAKVATTELAEVVISFGDYIFRGSRVQKKDERRFDAFESPGYFPIGYITEDIVLNPEAKKKRKKPKEIDFKCKFEKGIIMITLIPGLEPDLFLPVIEKDDCKGIILQSFGWGNVPGVDPYSFEGVIRKTVNELNKPVIITSQFPARSTIGSAYELGIKAVKAGAIPTGNMTSASATAKFRWILAQVKEEIEKGSLKESEKIEEIRKRMGKTYVREMD